MSPRRILRRPRAVLLVFASIAALGGGGYAAWWLSNGDERRRDAVADAASDLRDRASSVFRSTRVARSICDGVTREDRARLAAYARASRLDGAEGCAAGMVGDLWRVDPLLAGSVGGALTRDAVRLDGDDRATIDLGTERALVMRRQDGAWRADLGANREWTWRMDVSTACGITMRRTIEAGVPRDRAGFRRMYRAQARALRRFARTIRKARPARDRRASERRLLREVRRAADRLSAKVGATARIGQDGERFHDLARSPRGHLPHRLGTALLEEIGPCLRLRGTSAYESSSPSRAEGRTSDACGRWERWSTKRPPAFASREAYLAELRGAMPYLDAIATGLRRTRPPKDLRRLERRIERLVDEVRSEFRDMIAYAGRGDSAAFLRVARRWGFHEFGMRVALEQRGIRCA